MSVSGVLFSNTMPLTWSKSLGENAMWSKLVHSSSDVIPGTTLYKTNEWSVMVNGRYPRVPEEHPEMPSIFIPMLSKEV